MKNKWILMSVAAVLVAGIATYLLAGRTDRAFTLLGWFKGFEQHENFNRMIDLFPYQAMSAAPEVFEFPVGESIELPKSYRYKEQEYDTQAYLEDTDTAALLVLHDGVLVYENYWQTGGRDVNWLAMSVSKSFTSTAVGIAVDEGLIDITKAISEYLPELVGSAYEGVPVKDVLQMSSGAAWDETYYNPFSDVMRMGTLMTLGGSVENFVASMDREFDPGTLNRYNSADTMALTMLLAKVTGMSQTKYMEEKLWHPLGMESDAYWLTDENNIELGFMGLNATPIDYAKLGELFRLKGKWGEQQIVSEEWVQAATTPDAPHVMPFANEEYPLGYGFQWWIPDSAEGEFLGIGVYHQFVYVNPTRKVVIVKNSAFAGYGMSSDESTYREMESIEFFREVAKGFESSVTNSEITTPASEAL